ncbi:uncharacterized protein LOC128952344 [Oppia nitens]|uniref:uncharacterized protein LOC128952344 n=1 Tax=Oppia nitens TaxID=1686743 RepID=UPI0023DB4380|nr:uncharacterized protein LOC128952344 [Oppia nitens]
MGLICCCFRPNFWRSKRTRLATDEKNVSINAVGETVTDGNTILDSSQYRTPTVGLSEQNRFDLTVQKMAAKMINISANSETVPQHFWRERQKTYAKKLLNIRSPLPLRSKTKKNKTSNVSIQQRCASMTGISSDEIDLINKYSQLSSDAVARSYHHWSDEPIVVEFNPK